MAGQRCPYRSASGPEARTTEVHDRPLLGQPRQASLQRLWLRRPPSPVGPSCARYPRRARPHRHCTGPASRDAPSRRPAWNRCDRGRRAGRLSGEQPAAASPGAARRRRHLIRRAPPTECRSGSPQLQQPRHRCRLPQHRPRPIRALRRRRFRPPRCARFNAGCSPWA